MKTKSTCNDDILFVSPISHNRNKNNITKDSNPGDETKEFANMVIEKTNKPQVRQNRGSRSRAD